MSIHSRIKQLREARGLSMEALARMVGVKAWQTIQQWEREDGTAPKRDRMQVVADALETTPEFLILGEPGAQNAQASPDVCLVKEVDVKASAGTGRLVFQEDPLASSPFRADFLRAVGVKPQHALLLTVAGQSMEPTLPDGSSVLVDTSQKTIHGGRIHVVRIDDELLVKRLEKTDGKIAVVSDNPDKEQFPTRTFTNGSRSSVKVLALARWVGALL